MLYKKESYRVIGVMSGTSLDGIDIAEISFSYTEDNVLSFSLGIAETIPYSDTWKSILQEAIHYSKGRLDTLNKKYTAHLAKTITAFISKNKLQSIDAVCSHGHTILHQPDKGVTLQIGNLPELATLLQQTVVCDFRVQDVFLGGQGAPLVPIGDQLLFANYDYCLNLGGFANCSSEIDGIRIAYDICPVNIVLNSLAEKIGLPYDEDGKIASNSKVDQTLLRQLNALPFYKAAAPKSLGLEWVQQFVFPLLAGAKISVQDKIATFTEHIAQQLAAQFEPASTILVTGGGTYNSFLLEQLRQHNKVRVELPTPQLIEFKEALVFGLLGVLRLRNEINCLASVTGAKNDHSSGVIFSPS